QAEQEAGRATPHDIVSRIPPTALYCRLAAPDAVRKQADRGGEIGRAVPLHDDLEIRIDEIDAAPRPVGGHERAAQGSGGESGAVRVADAEPLPLRQGPLHLEADELRIEGRRQADRTAPGLVGPPSGAREIVGDGGEDIRLAGPDIPPAIAVEIDGVA